MQERRKLTAVVITKNEEKRMRTCLESIKWADEIVIVDGFSTDKTIDICREYTDKIVLHKHDGNFDKDRNAGADAAEGDWILQLDADEIVTEGMRKEVEKILTSEVPYCAYRFKRKNYFLGHFMRYGGWYHNSLHFFRKGKARYQGRIHETLIVDGEIGQINADVEHYPFSNLSQFIARHNRYSSKEAKKIFETKGIVSEKELKYHLKVRPLKLFWKLYFKKKGFKEGIHGIVFSFLFAWVHFINWAKYWELVTQMGTDEK